MISNESLQTISHMFCGDAEGYFSYKSGAKLVEFFNEYFKHIDEYGEGFSSRWIYVYDKLKGMLINETFDDFLNLVLSKEYLMRDLKLTQVESAEISLLIHNEFNRIVQTDLHIITHANGKYHLCEENSDLVFVGSGGFANVYRQNTFFLELHRYD